LALLNQARTFDPLPLWDFLNKEDLSVRAKVLVLMLSFTLDGGQINQEELSKALGANSKSNVVQRTVAEAERAGYLDVDRSVKPHWYRVTR
jgi:hypothetical protein